MVHVINNPFHSFIFNLHLELETNQGQGGEMGKRKQLASLGLDTLTGHDVFN